MSFITFLEVITFIITIGGAFYNIARYLLGGNKDPRSSEKNKKAVVFMTIFGVGVVVCAALLVTNPSLSSSSPSVTPTSISKVLPTAARQALVQLMSENEQESGYSVSSNWQIASAQQAPEPQNMRLDVTNQVPPNIEELWCIVITPPITVAPNFNGYPNSPISDFFIYRVGLNWTAFPPPGDNAPSEQDFGYVGCTNY